MKNKKIALLVIILGLFINQILYSNEKDDLNKRILGTWQAEDKVQNAVIITKITFKPDKKFVRILEEAVGKDKASNTSLGNYEINKNTITLEYTSFEGISLVGKDCQIETFDVFISAEMLGFPAYNFQKTGDVEKYSTKFFSHTINSKYGFDIKETTEEIVELKSNTISIKDIITKNQKGMGKEKSDSVTMEKSGTFKKDKSENLIITFIKSSVDKETTLENPETKDVKIYNFNGIALINPFIKVK